MATSRLRGMCARASGTTEPRCARSCGRIAGSLTRPARLCSRVAGTQAIVLARQNERSVDFRTVDALSRDIFGGTQAVLIVCLDDCGNFSDSAYISFCGFATDSSQWSEFQREWRKGILEPNSLPTLHTADLMNFRGHYKREKGWDEARRVALLDQCAAVINKWIIVGIAIVVDVKAYAALSADARRRIGKPEELCFTRCLSLLVNQLVQEGYDYPLAIIIDDCEHFSMRCYGMLRQIKKENK